MGCSLLLRRGQVAMFRLWEFGSGQILQAPPCPGTSWIVPPFAHFLSMGLHPGTRTFYTRMSLQLDTKIQRTWRST